MKGFVIAAPNSGAGKTTVCAALMAALKKRGLRVQPFKCGPDFIDPGHHRNICGRPSHNLDTRMLSAETNQAIFASACYDADVAVVEGMMGLFDGVRGTGEEGSSAEIAKLLGIPVVLVVDASAAARSVAALVKGFQTFDPKIRIVGIILNRVAGTGHAQLLIDALSALDPELQVGWMPYRREIQLKERHLGLQTAQEHSWTTEEIALLASLVEAHVPLERLLGTSSIKLCSAARPVVSPPLERRVRIGIARDRAFCFYYEAGLDELRRHGAEFVQFSPLTDAHLPPKLDALYFGGGYPEFYAEPLSNNTSLLADLREFAGAGKLVYGECGGLIFLGRELLTLDGKSWPMAQLLPLSIQMTERLIHFGYADVEFLEESLAPQNTCLRGHSFHCSRIASVGDAKTTTLVRYSLSGTEQREGFIAGNVFGSYIHLHFAADPSFAARFVSLARTASKPMEVH
jgi:cobyrinic acid a,c-diamide synthase